MPTELYFLKEGDREDSLLRQRCAEETREGRLARQALITKLKSDYEGKLDALNDRELAKQIESGISCLPVRTKNELESALYHKFDVNKKDRRCKDAN